MPLPTTLATTRKSWQEQLQAWAADGSLASAARHALELDDDPPQLIDLVSQWTEGDFSALPPIVLLPASSMPGAAGAYAISTGSIYLNEDWLETASDEQVIAVLTEELVHHLDALLNPSDTAGDEGKVFSSLLKNPNFAKKDPAKIDLGSSVITIEGIPVQAELSSLNQLLIKSEPGYNYLIELSNGDQLRQTIETQSYSSYQSPFFIENSLGDLFLIGGTRGGSLAFTRIGNKEAGFSVEGLHGSQWQESSWVEFGSSVWWTSSNDNLRAITEGRNGEITLTFAMLWTGGNMHGNWFGNIEVGSSYTLGPYVVGEYTFSRDGELIGDRTYRVKQTDLTKNKYRGERPTSFATEQDIAIANSSPEGLFEVNGTFIAGTQIKADQNSINDPEIRRRGDSLDTIFDFAWQVFGNGEWETLTDTDAQDGDDKYIIRETDAGKRIRSVATYVDAGKTTEKVYSQEYVIGDEANEGVASFRISYTKGDTDQITFMPERIADDPDSPAGIYSDITYKWERRNTDNNTIWGAYALSEDERVTVNKVESGPDSRQHFYPTWTNSSSWRSNEIRLTINYTDEKGFSETFTTEPLHIGLAEDSGPGKFNISLAESSGKSEYREGDTLIAPGADSIEDPDGVDATRGIVYKWYRYGWLVGSGKEYQLPTTFYGSGEFSVEVSYWDQNGYRYWLQTDSITADDLNNGSANPATLISNRDIVLNGDTFVLQTSAYQELDDPDGLRSRGSVDEYIWYQDNSIISGETKRSIDASLYGPGNYAVQVKYIDAQGYEESVTSDSVYVFSNSLPTGDLNIDGTATQGSTLTVDTSTIADADGLGSFSYQWNADGTTIAGATGGTLVLSQDQVGKAITVVASYTDGGGTAESLTSAATAVVADVNDSPTVATSIPDQKATEDAAFSFAVPGDTFADVDAGDTLTLSATLADGSDLPAWLTFTPGTGVFSGTPGNGDVGSITVNVTATDSANASVADEFIVLTANSNDLPETHLSISSQSIRVGSTIAIPINISDAAGVESLDLNLSYDPAVFSAPTISNLITPGSLTPGAAFVVNDTPPGQVSISWAGSTPITGGTGSIATLNLQVRSDATPGETSLIDLLSASVNEGRIPSEALDGSISILPPTLQVQAVRAMPNGIALALPEAPDMDAFNLYDGPEDVAVDQPDLTLTGPNGESVALSAHWQASSNELLLLSSDPLAAGDYSLSVDSRSDGLISAASGELLDGNGDGTPGDPFSLFFTHNTPEHLLSIADTARGAGQQLSLNGTGTHDPLTGAPLAASVGLPIHLSTTSFLTSFSGSLSYDQQLLLTPELNTDPSKVLRAGSDLLDDWTLSIDPSSQPGELLYSATGSTAISGSNLEILRFQATVSSIAAPPAQGSSSGNGLYGATTLIQSSFSSDQLPTDPLTGTPLEIDTDPGLIALAYAGDTTGNGTLSSLDASRVQRVVVGLDSGFDAYDSIDPVLIGDTTGNGTLSSLDASRIQQQVVGLEVDSFPDAVNLPQA